MEGEEEKVKEMDREKMWQNNKRKILRRLYLQKNSHDF